MSKQIFISHVHEEEHWINKMEKWERDGTLGDVHLTKELEDKRHEGMDAIRNYVKDKIQSSFAVIVLIGKEGHNHDWIRTEAELANSYSRKILCVRIPETKGAKPEILAKYKEINFDPQSIKRELESSN